MPNSPAELKWIDEQLPAEQRAPPRDWDQLETRTSRSTIFKKCADNLLVPLGLVATTACLTLGLFNLQKGDAGKQQFYMRGRVIAQGFTLAAMGFTMFMTQKKRDRQKAIATK